MTGPRRGLPILGGARRSFAAYAVVAAAAFFALSTPSTAAEPANGLYLMTRYGGGVWQHAAWLFVAGQVTSEPYGPLQSFNWAAARARFPNETGTYTLRNNVMTVIWANRRAEKSVVEHQSGKPCFKWQLAGFCPVTPFNRGDALEGSFAGRNEFVTQTGGRVRMETALTLHRDGSYALDGQTAIFPGALGPYSTDSPSRPAATDSLPPAAATTSESGKYAFEGAEILFWPSHNKKHHEAIAFAYDDGSPGPRPRQLYFNGLMLQRVR